MLNISPINFTKITNNFAKANQPIKQGLTQDVFVKSTNNVSFKGSEEVKNTNNFIQWAEKTDFINSQLDDVLSNPENILGSGFLHTAYKIPNNDDFVLN